MIKSRMWSEYKAPAPDEVTKKSTQMPAPVWHSSLELVCVPPTIIDMKFCPTIPIDAVIVSGAVVTQVAAGQTILACLAWAALIAACSAGPSL
jgi:hypothetical protein